MKRKLGRGGCLFYLRQGPFTSRGGRGVRARGSRMQLTGIYRYTGWAMPAHLPHRPVPTDRPPAKKKYRGGERRSSCSRDERYGRAWLGEAMFSPYPFKVRFVHHTFPYPCRKVFSTNARKKDVAGHTECLPRKRLEYLREMLPRSCFFSALRPKHSFCGLFSSHSRSVLAGFGSGSLRG